MKLPNYEVMKYCVEQYMSDVKELVLSCWDAEDIEEALTYNIKTQNYNNVYGGGESDPTTSAIRQIQLLAKTKYRFNGSYIQYKQEHARITKVKDWDILWENYIEQIPLNLIAEFEHASLRSIKYRKKQAIIRLYLVIPEDYKRFAIPNALE